MKTILRKIKRLGFDGLYRRVDEMKAALSGFRPELQMMLLAELNIGRVWGMADHRPLKESEFRVYSQFGEDGIVQYLVSRMVFPDPSFVEFGVEDYTEANTRLLLVKQNWRGLILDGDPAFEEKVRCQPIFSLHSLKCRSAFITAENINHYLSEAGFTGDIGLLSIDIDGNDYWVWKAIEVASPRIVVCEYNSIFGCKRQVSIPYNPVFQRFKAHHSGLYAGASLPALCQLAGQKGYAFVGSNTAGNNAFFVRKDVAEPFRVLTPQEGYVLSRFRESRDIEGKPSYLEGVDRLREIGGLPLEDLESGLRISVQDLITSEFSGQATN